MDETQNLAQEPAADGGDALQLIAYHAPPASPITIAPSSRWRTWMNDTEDRWANRCLPLIVANEAGWVLQNPIGFEAMWSGDPRPSGVTISFDEDVPQPHPVQGHFGYGIVTWGVPYLFRTPPGFNLLARGPANWPKDGICALEGLVETDWSVATFTMNWKLTRTNAAVRFEAGEPFCMIVPQRRGELERFRPAIRPLDSDATTFEATKVWVESRHQAQVRKFLGEFSGEHRAERDAWQRHYFKGSAPDGTQAPAHQTHLKLAEFERDE